MRIKFLPALLVAFSAMLLLASCGKKSNTQGRYIPKDAVFVAHLNGASLTEKLPWDEVKANNAFKMAYTDSSIDAIAKAAMENPENTGVDIKTDMVFFVVKDSAGGYAAFQGKVKDAAKFKSYYTTALKNATASEKDGIQFLTDGRVAVSWDKDKFIMLSDLPEMNQVKELEKRDIWDTTYTKPTFTSTRNTVTAATALYTLKEDNSLAKEERFSQMINDKGDLHFWMNVESLYKGMPGMEALAMINMSKLYEDSRYAATASFENGQIKVDMKSYAGKEMTDIYKKYSGSKVSSEMAEHLPAKDIAVFFAMNFKPEGIKEFIKLTGMEGLVNMGTAFLGFNMDDFIKANKGDILLAVSDFAVDSFGRPNPKVLFSASIGDKASFDKLMAAGVKMGKAEMGENVAYQKNDKYFVIGNDKTANDQFINGKGGSKPAFWDKISGGPIAGYVNLQVILNAMKGEIGRDSFGLRTLQASQKFWNDIILSGGEFKDGGIVQHVEINLLDKTTNSLKQLNKYIDELAVIEKQKKESYKYTDVDAMFPPVMDSVAVAPVAP
ncbi:MAG: DUF4836 family protein [Rhizobacter sp.]|nr:DUF4836 family protein [Ferruginibacter sp.]